MGTEVAISFSALRAQLENEKSSLFKIDENIKKIVQTTGRFNNDRFNNSTGEFGRARVGTRNSFTDNGNPFFHKSEDPTGKRKQETKTVFSRISARVHESDGEDEGPGIKRNKVSSTVSRELPTRAAVLRAQGDDEQAKKRNRRIFGSLLGTLQKFKQEEIVLQSKEEKRAQVERKIEEQARLEKEREQKHRKTLFAERDHKKANIKALEAKMARVQEFERWEASQKSLDNFILTKAKPHVYWLPKKMTEKAVEKLNSSRKYHEKCMIKKRQELQEELHRIEQRCLRIRGPGAKENNPATSQVQDDVQKLDSKNMDVEIVKDEERGKKRDKFAMDVDKDKEESDGDDHHEEVANGNSDSKSEDKAETPDVEMLDTSKKEEETSITEAKDVEKAEDTEPSDTSVSQNIQHVQLSNGAQEPSQHS